MYTYKTFASLFLVFFILSTNASAGFMDAFNKANQTIQQTTGTIDSTKRTADRVGKVLPKKQAAIAQTAQPVAPATSGELTAKDRAAIEKAKRAWVAAFKAEDWDALVDQYSADAIILPPDEPIQSGRAAVKANFNSGEDTTNEVFETIEINGDDRIAFVQGAFSFTIAGNPPVDVSGKYIEIWQKQEDGTWMITHDIWNANPPK